jgi:alkyldihydroxyacetonephosphate synthase
VTVERRRRHWGWGYEDEEPVPAAGLAEHLGFGSAEIEAAVPLDAV